MNLSNNNLHTIRSWNSFILINNNSTNIHCRTICRATVAVFINKWGYPVKQTRLIQYWSSYISVSKYGKQNQEFSTDGKLQLLLIFQLWHFFEDNEKHVS